VTTQGEIASAFLHELGAPDNAVMRKAVIAWMRAESGTTIRANNPWNMTLSAAKETGIKTCGSWKSASSGLTFAAFCSPQDGARASARLLLHAGSDWRGYDHVVDAARAGDPIRFLNALAHSAWDGGRYGTKNGGPNKLLNVYASLGGDVSSLDAKMSNTGVTQGAFVGAQAYADAFAKISSGATGTQNGDNLAAWGGIVSFPVGHVLTAADVDYIMAQLAAHGYFKDDTVGAAQSVTRAILSRQIGKAWGKPMQDILQADFYKSAGEAIPKPLDAIASIAGALTQILAALFDPRKWAYILALFAGVGLTVYGGTNVLSAAR
jgi:hypothetical protein